jgi:hypothetical protein
MNLLVLPAVGCNVTQDAQLLDVGVVFRVEAIEFRMQSGVAGAGQTSISFFDLGVRVTLLEVDHVIIAGNPGGHLVGDFVYLWGESFMLNETAQGFGVTAENVLSGGLMNMPAPRPWS